MIQRVARSVAGGGAWARERALVGISRLCLEGIALAGRLRAALPRRARPAPAPGLRASPPIPPPAGASGLNRLAPRLLDAILFGTTVYVVILMHREVYARMETLPAYRARWEELRLVQHPSWAPRETLTVSLAADPALERAARGYASGLVAEVGRRFERNPWVRRVVGVRRVYPDRIQVRIELRRPLGRVLQGTCAMLVDEEGVRLPDLAGGTPLPAGCTEIRGVDGPAPEVGARWNHEGVRAALEVAQALEEFGVARVLIVGQIDVSNFGGRRDPGGSEIVCWSASGVPVAWGRSPSTTRFGENAVAVKMQHLALALEAFPGLRGLERVDVRYERVVVRPRPEWRGLAAADVPGRPRR